MNYDTILYNGIVRTLDHQEIIGDAIGIKDGIIRSIGKSEELIHDTSQNNIVDLRGGLILPGFVDSHMHLLDTVKSFDLIDLSSVASLDELIEKMQDSITHLNGEEFVFGNGWNNESWSNNVMPTRNDLDKISEEIPVCTRRICYHLIVVNTPMLKLIKLIDESGKPNIPKELSHLIDVDEKGMPTGVLREESQELVTSYGDVPSKDSIKKSIIKGCSALAKTGITCVHTDDLGVYGGKGADRIIKAYIELAEDGKLPINVYAQCALDAKEKIEKFIALGYKTGMEFGSNKLNRGTFKIGPLKLYADGSLGARTAAMEDCYIDKPESKGVLTYSDEEMVDLITFANSHGMDVVVHGIGDKAIKQILTGFENSLNMNISNRNGIVHCQCTDVKTLDRIADDGVIAYVQPEFISDDIPVMEKAIAEELMKTSMNWKGMVDRGIVTCGGSDSPVVGFNPIDGIHYAVKGEIMNDGKQWYKENRLSISEAVDLYTVNCAYASYDEEKKGEIKVGKYADIVVLDRDIFSNGPEKIKDVKVSLTIVKGEII